MRIIDGDALFEDLKECMKDSRFTPRQIDGIAFAATRIFEQPTIEPEPHWIPCNERLPDIESIYIVLVDENQLTPNEIRVSCAYWLDRKWQYGVLESYEHKMPKLVIEPLEELTVVAWMPLPEPYQGKRKGADDEKEKTV